MKAQELRDELTSVLLPAFKKLEQAANRSCYGSVSIIDDSKLDQSVIYWRDIAAEEGDVETARRQEQVWSEFIRLLDEYIYIFGEKSFD